MPLFSSANPFDADVEKATNENNTTEEWGVIMEICDKVGNSSINAKECYKAIVKRLHNPDPHVQLQAITLLDACVNNCGKAMKLEIASREFQSELIKLIPKLRLTKVGARLRLLIRKWAENEFKTDPQLNLIPALFNQLRSEGVEFPDPNKCDQRELTNVPVKQNKDAVSTQQEVDDIAKAIELSLKDQGSNNATNGTVKSSSIYPSINSSPSYPSVKRDTRRKVKALYDFEAAEDNELTFFEGEIITVTDDSDDNWWKGCNQHGEGLFPANFVTADLSSVTENMSKKNVQFNDVVEVKTIKQVENVEIKEEKIDRLLYILHEADPTGNSHDSDELLILEDEVNRMGPLIDNQLEKIDRKHAELTALSTSLVEAFTMYHNLMQPKIIEQSPSSMPPQSFHQLPPIPLPNHVNDRTQAPVFYQTPPLEVIGMPPLSGGSAPMHPQYPPPS